MLAGLSIGKLSARTGLSVSAIRFYEEKGLISPDRNAGGQRRFARSDLRRLSFIIIMQRLGFALEEIRDLMSRLPAARTPTKRDWEKISGKIQQRIDQDIARLEQTRRNLNGCIGCGCLSLKACALYNAEDKIARKGAGPRYTMGDSIVDPDV
ncbi:MAG: redox-sensitive transcriptional activator SoxR [Pseudomonadota bacterium]